MNAEELLQANCPRCTAPLRRGASDCDRCGLALEPVDQGLALPARGLRCPRCDRSAEPGDHYVGLVGRSAHGSCPHCGTPLVHAETFAAGAYEERSLACDTFELERLARAEAVDGWNLLDTTIDPHAPGRIVAYFRRGLPQAAASEAPARGAPGTRNPASAAPARRTGPPEYRRGPSIGSQPASGGLLRREARAARRLARAQRRQASARRFAAPLPGAGRRGPVARHAWSAGSAGHRVVTGVIAFGLHLAVFSVFFAFRYLVLPLTMAALRLAQAVLIALVDELTGYGPRGRRARYPGRRHARWA